MTIAAVGHHPTGSSVYTFLLQERALSEDQFQQVMARLDGLEATVDARLERAEIQLKDLVHRVDRQHELIQRLYAEFRTSRTRMNEIG